MISVRPLAVFLLAGVFAIACSEAPEEQRGRGNGGGGALNVITETVQFVNERTHVEAVGTSKAIQSTTLYAATSGEVVTIQFKSGQYKAAGEVLLELDQRDAKLAVELAEVKYADAKRLYERYQKSAASGATVLTTLDAAEAALSAARIDLDRAKVALEDKVIRAPFSGYVGITDIEVGDRIQTSSPITTLDDRNTLLVSFEVPELLVGKINSGDQVTVSTWNTSATTVEGEVIDLGTRIDPETRTFVVRASVDNPNDALRPGMSFRVNLNLLGESRPELAEISVQWGADGSYVWSVIDGKAKRIPVNIVQRQSGHVLVEANLKEGDLIVTEGIQRLRPGIEVKALRSEMAKESRNAIPSSETSAGGPG